MAWDSRPCQIAINYVLKMFFLVCMQKTVLLTVVCMQNALFTVFVVYMHAECIVVECFSCVYAECIVVFFLCVCRMHCCVFLVCMQNALLCFSCVHAECIVVERMQNALFSCICKMHCCLLPYFIGKSFIRPISFCHSEDLAQTLNICTLISIQEFQNWILVSMLEFLILWLYVFIFTEFISAFTDLVHFTIINRV